MDPSTKHLKPIGRVKGVRKMSYHRLRLAGGPAERQHIEARRTIRQSFQLQVIEREPREALLLLGIDREGRLAWIVGFRRTHLDEDDRLAVNGNDVDFAEFA